MKTVLAFAGWCWLLAWPRTSLAVANSVEDAVRHAPPSTPSAPPPEPSLSLSFLKLGLGLLVILALIWIASRWLRGRWPKAAGSDSFRVLGVLPLGPGKAVHLIEVADRVLVLGVAQDIRVLEVIEDPQRKQSLRSEEGKAPGFDRRLAEVLQKMADRRRTWLQRQRGRDGDD